MLQVSGVRDLGYNELAPATPVPGLGPFAQGVLALSIVGIASRILLRKRR